MKLFTLFVVTTFCIATVSHAQVSLGIRGGYINTGLELSGNNTAPGATNLNSWLAGFYTNIPLFKNGYLQPGVSYIVKGTELSYAVSKPDNLFTSGVTLVKLNYLELPVNMIYKVPVSFGKLLVGGGPYAAYCINGNYKLSVYDNGKLVQSGSQDLDFKAPSSNVFGTSMNLQRWDAGLNVTAGIELNCFLTLGVNYSFGLLDIDKSSGNNLKNRYWGVSLGFLFDREDW